MYVKYFLIKERTHSLKMRIMLPLLKLYLQNNFKHYTSMVNNKY